PTTPAVDAQSNRGHPHSPPLGDAGAQAAGAPANVRQAAALKSPIGDSSRNRRAWCSRAKIATSKISIASTTGASEGPPRPAPGARPKPPWGTAGNGAPTE